MFSWDIVSRSSRFVLVLAALALLGPVLAAYVAAEAAVRPPWTVTAIARDDLKYGDRLLIRGTVSPGARGKYVYVEARSPGSPVFQTRRAVMVRKGSKYSVSVLPTEPGVWRYRVLKPAGEGRRASRSPVQVVNVWRWRSLESMLVEPEESAGTTAVTGPVFGGLTFGSGYVQDPAGARFFRLRQQCARVDVWAGGDPTSIDDQAAEVQVDGAGGEDLVFSQHLATVSVRRDGPATRISLVPDQVRPVRYLRISYDGAVEGNRAMWGNPQAYCLF